MFLRNIVGGIVIFLLLTLPVFCAETVTLSSGRVVSVPIKMLNPIKGGYISEDSGLMLFMDEEKVLLDMRSEKFKEFFPWTSAKIWENVKKSLSSKISDYQPISTRTLYRKESVITMTTGRLKVKGDNARVVDCFMEQRTIFHSNGIILLCALIPADGYVVNRNILDVIVAGIKI